MDKLTPRKATGKEKILRALVKAGSFGLTTDDLQRQTGVNYPPRRIEDLRKDGHKINGGFTDSSRTTFRYRLVTLAPTFVMPPEPEPEPEIEPDFTGSLFPDEPQAAVPKNAIDDDWSQAA